MTRPLTINLTALVTLVLLGLLSFATSAVFLVQVVASLLAVGITVQLIVLALTAMKRIAPQAFLSKNTFALWFGAAYPFALLSTPTFDFPWQLVVAGAPIGYVVGYLGIAAIMWIVSWFKI